MNDSTGWSHIPFGKICVSLISGGTPDTGIHRFWVGTIPWITGADFGNQSVVQIRRRITEEAVQRSATHIVRAGNILLVTRTGVGKVAIAPFDVAISQDITGIYIVEDVDVGFIFYCLQSHAEEFKKLNQGTSINGILKEDLLGYEIDLPPLPEQRKIAKILTTVDNLIEKTEALIAKYQAIKQGMMHDLFTRGVDAHGHLRPPYDEAPELYKESELGWIPREWDTDRVGNLGEVKLGRQRSPKYQLGINPRPYLRVVNVFDDRLDLRDVLSMDFSPGEFEKYRLEPGDVLLTEGDLVGPWNVGRSAVYRGEIDGCCFQNTLICFRPQLQDASEYFHYAFCFLRSLGKFAQETMATTVFHLSAGRLKEIYTVLPPERERCAIAQTLLEQERVVDIQRKQHAKLLKLKAGLIQDLLTGNVRVKVDEPQEIPA